MLNTKENMKALQLKTQEKIEKIKIRKRRCSRDQVCSQKSAQAYK